MKCLDDALIWKDDQYESPEYDSRRHTTFGIPDLLFYPISSLSVIIELVSQMGFCDIPFQFFYALRRHFNTQTSCLVFCSPFFLQPFRALCFLSFPALFPSARSVMRIDGIRPPTSWCLFDETRKARGGKEKKEKIKKAGPQSREVNL